MNGASVPAIASPATASPAAVPDGDPPSHPAARVSAVDGGPSSSQAAGTVASAAASTCTAVTATGSRPASIRGCATTNAADRNSDPNTSRSPRRSALPPRLTITPTPVRATAKPSQASTPTRARPNPIENNATSTGVAPTISAA
ncbi:MAG: hypothetical protein QOI74_3012 [Micromonosporaceae bacterium]|nr:hypothetical protein [Micromonosporaceae bacterium]